MTRRPALLALALLASGLLAAPAGAQTVSLMLAADPTSGAQPDDSIVYTITLTADADVLSGTASLSFPVPAQTVFDATTAPASCTAPAQGGTGTVSCSGIDLSSGFSLSFDVTVVVEPTDCATKTTTATVSGSASCEIDDGVGGTTTVGCSPSSADATTALSFTGVDFAVTLAAIDGEIEVGDVATFQTTVRNEGAETSSGTQLTAALPTGLTFKSAAASMAACASTPGDAGEEVLCLIDPLAAGAFTTIFLQANAADDGDFDVTATVEPVSGTADFDCDASDDSATDSVTVTPKADVSIASVADGPDPAFAGELLTYTISVLNEGPGPVDGATLTVEGVADGTTFVGVAPAEVTCAGTDPPTFTCTLPEIAANDTLGIELQMTTPPSAAGTFTTTVRVTNPAGVNDPDTGNDSQAVDTELRAQVDASVALTAIPDPVPAGGTLTLETALANAGPSTARDVEVTLTPPPEVTIALPPLVVSALRARVAAAVSGLIFADGFESGDLSAWSSAVSTPPILPDPPPCSVAVDGTVTCTIDVIDPGQTVVLRFSGAVAADAAGQLTTTLSAVSSDVDVDRSNDEASATVAVARNLVDLAVTVADTPDPVPAGTTLTYTFVVENGGSADATGSELTVFLPLDVSLVSALVSTGGSCSGNPLVCALGILAAEGGQATVTLQTLVAVDAPPVVTVEALATANEVDANTGDDEVREDTTVQ